VCLSLTYPADCVSIPRVRLQIRDVIETLFEFNLCCSFEVSRPLVVDTLHLALTPTIDQMRCVTRTLFPLVHICIFFIASAV
jgi:hypothetical protein